jgi:hypothetical protein
MTTRRHPRTLQEAFPADHWENAIAHYRRPLAQRVADVLLAVALGLGLACTLFFSLSA